jgi:uncharacterized membrane protein (DUF373 family)
MFGLNTIFSNFAFRTIDSASRNILKELVLVEIFRTHVSCVLDIGYIG